jgi:hypothetical protein
MIKTLTLQQEVLIRIYFIRPKRKHLMICMGTSHTLANNEKAGGESVGRPAVDNNVFNYSRIQYPE